MTDKQIERIEEVVLRLQERMFGQKRSASEVMSDMGIRVKKVPYGHRGDLFEDCFNWDEFEDGGSWGEPDRHYLFRLQVEIPQEFEGKEVFFFLSTGADDIWNTDNPQMLIYINGERRSGMDMNHNCVSIYEKKDWTAGKDRHVDIAIYAYSNLSENGNLLNVEIAALDEIVKDCYFDMLVPFEAVKAWNNAGEQDNKNTDVIINHLEKACELTKNGNADDAGLVSACAYLKDNLYGSGENPAVIASVGHTHIDVAWKWQLRQTREKVVRSFSTVMELMKRYPEYLFMSSTPQLYEYVREEEPDLFDEVLKRAQEGRFEIEGAMWLEADCNLTSGESLVRQILYGKRYMKEVFGVDSKILWLPDVFGYSAAMPQILRKSGVKAFVTTKLAWNDTNRMPYDLFMWQGIDGSDIPTFIITTCDYPNAVRAEKEGGILNYTYNGRQNSSQIMGTWRAFREKNVTDELLTLYGFGDGGGGPTWEMLEMDRRLRLGVPGVPITKQKSVTEFMDGLLDKIKDGKNLPRWTDELYLEFHRGTYTSMAQNKKYNRRLEHLLREAEYLCVLAHVAEGSEYPRERLDPIWKVLMINQFHDILPGSSIEEVYQDSKEQYDWAISEAESIIDSCLESTSIKKLMTVDGSVNEAGEDKASEKAEGSCHYEVVEEENPGPTALFTEFYSISIDENGEIVSLFDRENNREIRNTNDVPLNRLIAFEDKPKEYDAWNIDADFENVNWNLDKAEKVSIRQLVEADGKRSTIEVLTTRVFRKSTIWQTIRFYSDSRRIDFETKADWHEHQILLKAAFPVDVDAEVINCEIQFGHISRNLKRESSWDKAKFECCAQKWIDMTDKSGTYGVAVLNDSKYGYDAKEKLMRLTLIKSGIFPNPNADQGIHEFTYSLLPHSGDFRSGKVIEEARALNERAHFHVKDGFDGSRLRECIEGEIISFENSDGVFVDAIKLSEVSEDVIIRMYEGYGEEKHVRAKISDVLKASVKSVCGCDLLENELDGEDISYNLTTGEVEFTMKPFEIKTIRLKR